MTTDHTQPTPAHERADTAHAAQKTTKHPLRTVAIRSLLVHRMRMALTVLSVFLGTAFIAGSLMFTATLGSTFTELITKQYDAFDLTVSGPTGTKQSSSFLREVPVSFGEELRARDDVKSVEMLAGSSTAIITGHDGKPLQSGGSSSMAFPVHGQETETPMYRFTEGRPPEAVNEIGLNDTAAKKGGLTIGDTTTIITAAGHRTVTITGIYALTVNVGGYIGAAVPETVYLDDYAPDGQLSELWVSLQDGVDKDAVRAELAHAHPEYFFGDAKKQAAKDVQEIKKALVPMNYFLWAFAAIALIVGTFLIGNTFTVTVAERIREFALLRAMGASRRQITGSVVTEAVILGLIGSGFGILGGAGLAALIFGLLDRFTDMGVPMDKLDLTPTSIAVPLAIGVLVTVTSAWVPARRAGGVHPVAAMRSGSQEEGSLLIRSIIGGLLSVTGIISCLLAAFGGVFDGQKNLAMAVGIGAVAIIVGVWLIGPALSKPVAGGLGKIIGLPFGAVGRLACSNSRRNPRRTAATAFALTIGLASVASIGMLGATMKSSMEDSVGDMMNADFIVASANPMAFQLPSDLPERVEDTAGVETVAAQWMAPLQLGEKKESSSSGAGQLIAVSDFDFTNESKTGIQFHFTEGDGILHGKKGIIVNEEFARQHGWKLGDMITLSLPGEMTGKTTQAPVTGIYTDFIKNIVVSLDAAKQIIPVERMSLVQILVMGDGTVTTKKLRANLEDTVAKDLIVSVMTPEQMAAEIGQQISVMLNVLYGLLALAIIIAILGIVNTLALSITERTREIGMLRAVGMKRGQIRRMIRLESVVIALYGAISGGMIGVFAGTCFVFALSGDEASKSLVIPWGFLGGMLVTSAIVGVLAALAPAAKAAKTPPLAAMVGV